ncbi:hypothetical protein BN2537_7583 [Streptomyces venezuelae]|nr:hypothetical protein BN2537_7583 [Streptomyces venezuelae]
MLGGLHVRGGLGGRRRVAVPGLRRYRRRLRREMLLRDRRQVLSGLHVGGARRRLRGQRLRGRQRLPARLTSGGTPGAVPRLGSPTGTVVRGGRRRVLRLRTLSVLRHRDSY